ncbi:MAG: DUF5615 family PIN-like protein [Ignavibacteriales bacterium]|nr:DUF5615 family PIN-like protein [Ignavibacteriales bacterium]
MKIWIDAQFSPLIAKWLKDELKIDSFPLKELGLRDATDKEIFHKAKENDAIVLTKDADFLELLKRFGSPPKIIWVTCGNTSNKKFQEILSKQIERIKKFVDEGENLIEISD